MLFRSAGIGTAYPAAVRANSTLVAETVSVANVNAIGKADLTTQGTIGGVQVKTCNPGKQAPQNEFSVAVNPANPLNLVAGANDYRLYESSENRYDGSGGFYRSTDGGATWSTPIRLSTKSSDPSVGNLFQYPDCLASFIGDYTGIAVGSDRRAHPFWMDIRVGNSPGDPVSQADQDPYTATVAISQ